MVILSRTDYRVDGLTREQCFPGDPNGSERVVASVVRKNAGSISLSFEGKWPELEERTWR